MTKEQYTQGLVQIVAGLLASGHYTDRRDGDEDPRWPNGSLVVDHAEEILDLIEGRADLDAEIRAEPDFVPHLRG